MTVPLTIRGGTTRNYPQDQDEDYGSEATLWAQDVTTAVNNSSLKTNTVNYDVVISDDATARTHATLELAIADASVTAGMNVLIDGCSFTQNTTLNISKALNIYGLGNSTFQAGGSLGANPIIRISVDNVRFQEIKLDANSNSPTYAVQVDSGVTECGLDIILEGTFASGDIDNQSTDEALIGGVTKAAGNYLLPTTGTTYANTTLSNLASGLVKINDSLTVDTNNTYDLGDETKEYKDAYVHNIKHGDSSNPNLGISTTSDNGNINVSTNGTGNINLTPSSTGSTIVTRYAGTSTDSITAFSGGGQGSAVSLTTQFNRISTCAADGDSVKLPATFPVGYPITVRNDGAKYADLFPASGDTINGMAADTAIQVLPGETLRLFAHTADSAWITEGSFKQQIQDFTTVGDVGDSNQFLAGHQLTAAELAANLSAYSAIGLFNFPDTNIETDLTGNQNLTLVNVDDTNNTTGILNTDFAISLNGTDEYCTHPDAFDTPSGLTNGIAISCDFKANDGQPTGVQYLFCKQNDDTGASRDWIVCYLNTAGHLEVQTRANETEQKITFTNVFENGATTWKHLDVNWNTTYGLVGCLDGVCESNPNATTLMSDGSTDDFAIGASLFTGTPGNYFAGKIANFLMCDAIYSEKDKAFIQAATISEPSALQGTEYSIIEKVQPSGDASYELQTNPYIVTKYNNLIYLESNQYSPTDKVKLIGVK